MTAVKKKEIVMIVSGFCIAYGQLFRDFLWPRCFYSYSVYIMTPIRMMKPFR